MHPSAARPAPDTYPILTSTAPAIQAMYRVETETVPSRVASSPKTAAARQGTLFAEEPPPRTPRVIRFEEIAPPGHLLPPPRRHGPDRTTRTVRRDSVELQRRLDFQTVASQTHGRTFSNSTMYGNHAVATPLHRVWAAVADYSLIGVAMAIFFAVFYLAGGEIVLNKVTTPVYCAVPLIITFLYRALYCLGRGDTSGTQWLGLRVIDFDGKTPTRNQRWNRSFAGVLSLVSGGLGLLWALTDEEQLTWHDHISKTFPTPDLTRLASVMRKR
ncbi:MAG: RDD family protein [Bryobacterales bacterium]|nr:RDD family protein [Bryobacterales bacterium]